MALKIIGAGLGRTGTASTKLAIEQLGVGRCYHMGEVIAHPADINLWLRAADGNPDWDALFANYAATVDYPACTFWRELAAHYPEAKVLLNVRDPEGWFESVNQTIMSPQLMAHVKGTPFGELNERTIWRIMEGRMTDRAYMIAHFQRHIDEVRRTIPADRLLVFDVKQGWAPLCAFLGLAVPKGPFPRINTREKTRAMFLAMMAQGPEMDLNEKRGHVPQELFGGELK